MNGIALWSLFGCAWLPPAGDPARPDVVLVSIDTLRADHLSSYGYARETSPFLDGLAASGLRFERATSASPWTLPSHTTMLSGLAPDQHQVVEDDIVHDPSLPWLPEAFQAGGWATAGFVSTIFVSQRYGFGRGFDTFEDFDITEEKNLSHPVRIDRVIDTALAWLDTVPTDTPVFLFLHTYDVHYPYAPPAPYDTRFDKAGKKADLHYKNYFFYQKNPVPKKKMEHLVAQYDESIAWVDDQLARLQSALERRRRRVHWAVTSDHGEELGERGSWGHAHTLTPEQLHVPLILAGPKIAAPGVRSEPVASLDLAPTLAALAGVSWPPAGAWSFRGVSLLEGPRPPLQQVEETSRFETAKLGYQDGDLRLELDAKALQWRLFDHASDPTEQTDLAAARPEEVARLQAALLALLGEPMASSEPLTSAGVLFHGGARVEGALPGPSSFFVFPFDAPLTAGGWSGRGVAPGGPVTRSAPLGARLITNDDATRAALEALGYIQKEK